MNNDGCGLRSQYSKHLDHCQTPDCQTLRGLHNAARHLMEPATMEEDHNPIQTVCMVHGMANIQHRIDPCDGARSLRSHKINRRSRHQSPSKRGLCAEALGCVDRIHPCKSRTGFPQEHHAPRKRKCSLSSGPSRAGAHGPDLRPIQLCNHDLQQPGIQACHPRGSQSRRRDACTRASDDQSRKADRAH